MSKLRSLSLVLAGVVLGVGISYSSEIQAAANKLLGSKVTNTMSVKLNKKTIGQAAVINGVSYLPVRAVANELNLGVGVSGQDVNLTFSENVSKKAAEEQAEIDRKAEEANQKNTAILKLKQEIEDVKNNISGLEKAIPDLEKKIADNQNLADTATVSKDLYQQNVDAFTKDLAAAKDKLQSLNKELTELETKLVGLEK